MSNLGRGDYLDVNKECDEYITQQALRLKAYLQALRNKLEREKAQLADLKSETWALMQDDVARSGSPHLPACPMAKHTVQHPYAHVMGTKRPVQHDPSGQYQRLPRRAGPYPSVPYQPPASPAIQRQLDIPKETDKSNQLKEETKSKPPNPALSATSGNASPMTDLELILQKLAQVDNLCKQEMLRINQVGSELEPFKQISNDWKFQAEMSKLEESSDPEIQNIRNNTEPLKETNQVEELKLVEESQKSEWEFVEEDIEINIVETPFEENKDHDVTAKIEEETPAEPVTEELPVNPEVKDLPEPEDVVKPPTKCPKLTRSKLSCKEDMVPISWKRLVVDKKKRKLQTGTNWSFESLSSSSDSSSSNASGEKKILEKYMYSDSDYVYSPLFVSDTDETD